MFNYKLSTLLLALYFPVILLTSCGSEGLLFDVTVAGQSLPYVHRVDPANGKAGDTVIIYGYGFSMEAGNNIISFGNVSAIATAHTFLATPVEGESESVTAVIPSGATAGAASLTVIVFDNASNGNISFTVTE